MCNDFGNNIPYSEYLAAFSQIRAPVVFPTAAPNLEPRDDIWPTETAPVFRRREGGVEMVQLRWGFPPARPRERQSSTSAPRGGASDPDRTARFDPKPTFVSLPADRWVYRGAVICKSLDLI